jgi:transcription elongation factor GreB
VGQISLLSPVARALMRTGVGDEVRLVTPSGTEMIEVLAIVYPPA